MSYHFRYTKGTTDNMSTRPGEGFQQEAAEAYKQTSGKGAKRYVGQESPTQGRKTGLRAHEPPPSGHHRQSQKGNFDQHTAQQLPKNITSWFQWYKNTYSITRALFLVFFTPLRLNPAFSRQSSSQNQPPSGTTLNATYTKWYCGT